MASKKVKITELAKELGMTNKEMLELSTSMGIDVKSTSSSIEDAQADRVRRKAERDGLKRDKQPEEEKPAKKAPAKKAAAKKTDDGGDDAAPAKKSPQPKAVTTTGIVDESREARFARLYPGKEKLTFAEYAAQQGKDQAAAKERFEKMDKNDDGFVTRAEFIGETKAK